MSRAVTFTQAHCAECERLKAKLADETRRADVAEAWQKRLTALLAQKEKNA